MSFVITYRGTVYPWQCDHMGHMNVMWYVGKFDEATWQILSTLGLSRTRLNRPRNTCLGSAGLYLCIGGRKVYWEASFILTIPDENEIFDSGGDHPTVGHL